MISFTFIIHISDHTLLIAIQQYVQLFLWNGLLLVYPAVSCSSLPVWLPSGMPCIALTTQWGLYQKTSVILCMANEEGVITYVNDESETYHEQVVQHNYEGIINMVLRGVNETTSEGVRTWAENFMMLSTCPVCNWCKAEKKRVCILSWTIKIFRSYLPSHCRS